MKYLLDKVINDLNISIRLVFSVIFVTGTCTEEMQMKKWVGGYICHQKQRSRGEISYCTGW